MENVLIQKIKAHYPDAKIKIEHNREKSLINNFPYKNISVEIKPFNSVSKPKRRQCNHKQTTKN
jgi:hypothetical protein